MKDITKAEYAKWLGASLQAICEGDPQSIILASRQKDGNVVSGYYDSDGMDDRATLLCHLVSDLIMDIVIGNIEDIKDALDDLEEAEEEDD